MKIALYAGSFDPCTRGHTYVIKEASKMFDLLIVAIGLNPAKKSKYQLWERLAMLESAAAGLPNVQLGSYVGRYLVDYANEVKADFIVRGLRGQGDIIEEITIQQVNRDIAARLNIPSPSHVYLITPPELSFVSSSVVRSLDGFEGADKTADIYRVPVAWDAMLDLKIKKLVWDLLRVSIDDRLSNLLAKHYRQPHRYYHTLEHVSACLSLLHKAKDHLQLSQSDLADLVMAILFHDAVYDIEAGPGKNEKNSARIARDYLALPNFMNENDLGKPIPFDPERITNMIEETARHTQESPEGLDRVHQILLDIDMAILGSPAELYDRYVDQIKKEYNVSDELFAQGRSDFLRKILSKKRIFYTERFFAQFEKIARGNLLRELQRYD
jgi:pantetheine-phosphate adenylyltransferase